MIGVMELYVSPVLHVGPSVPATIARLLCQRWGPAASLRRHHTVYSNSENVYDTFI